MKKLDVNKILKSVKILLENNEKYKNMEIIYILKDVKNSRDSIVVAAEDESVIEINPFTNEIKDIPDFEFNFDEYLFKQLEKGKQIAYMTPNTHYGIWSTIEDFAPSNIEHKKGMQKYLKYCKTNKITKEKLEKECNVKDIKDVMKFYKEKKEFER